MCMFLLLAQLLQSCQTLCNSMDCSPPGSSVHGILQARILEWAAMPFSNIVFLYFCALITEEGFLISPCYSLELCIQMSIFYFSFSPLALASLLFSAICKASSDNHFAFLHFFFLGIVSITASCTVSVRNLHS